MDTKEILQQTQRIRVQLPSEASQKDVQIASTLMCGLRELKKDVRLDRRTLPEKTSHSSSTPQQTFVVSLKGLAPKISKVQYEKDKEDLRLYFTLQQGQISQENLSLQIQNQSDLTIIVGEQEELGNSWKEAALELLASSKTPETRLLAKVLQNLEYVDSLHMYAVAVQLRDFQETESTSKMLVTTALKIKEDFGSELSYLLLFEVLGNSGTQALLWTSQDDATKERLLAQGTSEQKGDWTLLRSSQPSIQQLRHAILK